MNGNDNLMEKLSSHDSSTTANIDISTKKRREDSFTNDDHVHNNDSLGINEHHRNDSSFNDFNDKITNTANDFGNSNHRVINNSNHGNNSFNTFNHHSFFLNEKKFKSYKLISDPSLKKGAQKIYRYDGIVSSKDALIQPKDPRSYPKFEGRTQKQIDLIIPRFKIDKNYVGLPPSIEVSITNLNDNINRSFLEDTLKKFDALEEIEIFYHPKTKKHLGLAKVIFMTPNGAKACVSKLNQTSVMGNIINVFFDPFAKKINQIYESIVNPQANPSNSLDLGNDNFVDPNKSLSRMTKNSDYSYDISSEYCSTFSTPSTFENQSFYSVNQYYDGSQSWNKSNTDSNSEYNKSPVRESLEERINNLLRKNKAGLISKFMNDDSNMSHMLDNDYTFHRKNTQKKIDDSDAILGTPPSPFVSASEYLKWHKITKEIDTGIEEDKTNNIDKFKQDSDKKNTGDDDDRMSLSSLSSGEKFESNVFEMNNNNDISTMIPGLNNWNSDTNSFNPGQAGAFNSLFPQFMYQSFVQNSSQPFGYFGGFSVPSALGLLNDSFNKKEDDNDDFSLRNKNKFTDKDMVDELLTETVKASIKDLKEILCKDIYKKIVENFAFKMFDQWWEESERKSKYNDSNISNDEERSPTFKKVEIHIPFFNNPIFENSIQKGQTSLSSNFEYGVSRGMRAAMGKMPSFKRKIIKPKSPSPLNDKLSDISDDEELINNRIDYRHLRRARILHRRRNRSTSSESSPSRDRSVSRKRYSSKSSSSRSSSSSSSSESSSASSSSSTSSSEASSSSSSSSSSSEDESSELSNVSSEEESEISESESNAASVSSISSQSISSKRSSIKSSKSKSSIKIASPKATLLVPEQKEEIIEEPSMDDHKYETDTSGTDTAEETLEELSKLEAMNRMNTNSVSDSFGEYEASKILLSLASPRIRPINDSNMMNNMNIVMTNNNQFDSVFNQILLEHNYFRQPIEEPPTIQPMAVPTPNKITAKQQQPKLTTKERKALNAEKKRKKKEINNKDNDDNFNIENIIPIVASEWRKAKRKTLTKLNDLNENLEEPICIDGKEEPPLPVAPIITFSARDETSEKDILYEFEQNGIDAEDIAYLKRRYTQSLQEANTNSTGWLNDLHWVDHPPTNILVPRKKRKTEDPCARIHKTGSARTEGYYKLAREEKMQHVPIACDDIEMDGSNALGSKQNVVSTQQLTREQRNQRRLMKMVEQSSNISSDWLKSNQLIFRKKQVKFARSKIHLWGLFALQEIPQDELVIEYIGQKIRPMVSEIRDKKYLKGHGSSYLFKIDSDTVIDATTCGNVSRFINHSCNPNCYAKVITVEGQKRIVIYSKQRIEQGQEITYDYKFPIEEDNKIPCLCGSAQCRRYLN